MLIDAGGHFVDIAINEIDDEYGNLRQLIPPSSVNFGSMNINLKIIEYMNQIFGKETIEKFIEENFEKWNIFKKEIEEIKISVCSKDSNDSDFKIENYFYNPIYLLVNKTYETFYGKISYNKNYIYFPNSLIKYMINKQIYKIIDYIESLFNKFKYVKIDHIIITGGFSNCYIFKKKLTKNFKQKIISQLFNPERSVVKGAALYGIKN